MKEENIEEKFDDRGRIIACIYGQDPKDPRSFEIKYDSDGRLIKYIYGQDFKNPNSFEVIYDFQIANTRRGGKNMIEKSWEEKFDSQVKIRYDSEGRFISCVYEQNQKDPYSFEIKYNSQGRVIACIFGQDPKNPKSWEEKFDLQGRLIARIRGQKR